jgi:hypothetical protein
MLWKIIKECRCIAYVGITVVAVAVSPSLISVVMAESPHEIDFTQQLTGIGDVPLTRCVKTEVQEDGREKCAEIGPLTLGDAAVEALQRTLDKDKNEKGTNKFERDHLARKIWKNAHAILSVDDIKLIKDRVGDGWSTPVVGAVWPLLDSSLSAEK